MGWNSGRPPPSSSGKENRSSSAPSLRWSRLLGLLQAVEVGLQRLARTPTPCRRCAGASGCARRPASRRRPPACSLKWPSRPVWATCGPRHRSMNVGRVLVGADDAAALGGRHRVGRRVLDDLELVRWSAKSLRASSAGDLVPDERLLLVDDLPHAGLDALEVVGRERGPAGQLEVVVEAVLDRRADAERGPREQVEHGLGQHVGRRVADGVAAPVGVGGDDGDRGRRRPARRRGRARSPLIVGDHRRLGQARADARREVARGGARRDRSRSEPSGSVIVDLGHRRRGYRAAPTAPAPA